jgi:hypothetical protein
MYARDIHSEPEVPSITTVIGMAPDLPAPTAKPPALGTRANVGALTGWRMRLVQDATAAYLRNSDELYHRFPHIPAAVTAARAAGRATEAQARAARNAIAATPDVIADAAAQRGDRVHEFAEALGQWQLGIVSPDTVAAARAALDEHGDGSYADVLIDWWARWRIEAVANEVTVWNHGLGVAGTLDIVFRAEGRLYVGDFKSKDDRHGQAKPMSSKVGMQLLNALHADEEIVDPAAGTWQPWRFGAPGPPPGDRGVSDRGRTEADQSRHLRHPVETIRPPPGTVAGLPRQQRRFGPAACPPTGLRLGLARRRARSPG